MYVLGLVLQGGIPPPWDLNIQRVWQLSPQQCVFLPMVLLYHLCAVCTCAEHCMMVEKVINHKPDRAAPQEPCDLVQPLEGPVQHKHAVSLCFAS